MSSPITDFIRKLHSSREVPRLLCTIKTSATGSHPTCHTLCQALDNSWSCIVSKFTSELEEDPNTECEAAHEDASSTFWAQVALDYSWEQLHKGHWKDVQLFWRQAYALAALLKALDLRLLGKREESLVEIDKGILLGAPIINSSLHVLAALISKETVLPGDDIIAMATDDSPESAEKLPSCRKIGKVKFRNYTPSTEYSDLQKRKSPSSMEEEQRLSCDVANIPLIDMMRRIPVINSPSLEDFYRHHMMVSVPVVISGAMDYWPAYAEKKWK